METKMMVLGFVVTLVMAFIAYISIVNRKMMNDGTHYAMNVKSSGEKEVWSLKNRRTTTVKKSPKKTN